MDLMEIGCDDGRWGELAQGCVLWWALVLAVLKLCVLLPESPLVKKKLNIYLVNARTDN